MLDENFSPRFEYPIIIFSDDRALFENSTVAQIRSARNHTALFFQHISLTIPEFLKPDDVPVSRTPCNNGQYFSIGYRHMCRFQAKSVYEQPIMAGLEYAWRLDDDSTICQRINFDVFAKMRDNNYTYGYALLSRDREDCVIGLWEASCKHAEANSLEISEHHDYTWMYYNNFEISKLSVWRSCEYRYYIDYIDQLGGIYYYRWGDATIKTIAVFLFVEKKSVYEFKDICYTHWILAVRPQ